VINKKNIGENINSNSNKDISCFSENFDYLNSNNNNNNYSNKFFSMRQSDIYNINNNQSFNYKFNLLNNNSTNNKKENEKIETNNYIYDNNNNFEESDIISLVSKNDVIKEKFQKLENDEKINKLIEEIFSIKAFKLYILDKFGNGKQDIFFKKIKNGEINKEELESELNLLKEIHNSNNDSDNIIDNNFASTESKKSNKHNKFVNKTMSDINKNLNLNNNIDTENNFSNTDKYNIYKKINRKKFNRVNEESKNKNPNNERINLRGKEKINVSNDTNSYVNKSKNISSHSVSSIRARIKSKKF
jgi:predicted metallopeptidase